MSRPPPGTMVYWKFKGTKGPENVGFVKVRPVEVTTTVYEPY